MRITNPGGAILSLTARIEVLDPELAIDLDRERVDLALQLGAEAGCARHDEQGAPPAVAAGETWFHFRSGRPTGDLSAGPAPACTSNRNSNGASPSMGSVKSKGYDASVIVRNSPLPCR